MPLSRRAAVTFILAVAPSSTTGLFACSLAVTGLSTTSADGGAEGDVFVPHDGTPPSDAATEANDGADVDSTDAPAGTCKGSGGPVAVNVGGYCIDATEVTVSQYIVFLGALDGGVPPALPAACSFKTAFAPQGPISDAGNTPIVWVDWCDAYAYCAWAGKRLCGRIGGGGNDPLQFADAAASEWFRACSFGGQRPYPYGATYKATACNGFDYDAGQPVVVGIPSCAGGFPGVFDLSGNVLEWESSCNAAGDTCRSRGGFYGSAAVSLQCDFDIARPIVATAPYTGIRCCSSP